MEKKLVCPVCLESLPRLSAKKGTVHKCKGCEGKTAYVLMNTNSSIPQFAACTSALYYVLSGKQLIQGTASKPSYVLRLVGSYRPAAGMVYKSVTGQDQSYSILFMTLDEGGDE